MANRKRFDKLKQSLFEKTGINFEEYQNEELADKLSGIMAFPLYAIKLIGVPMFLWPGVNLVICFYLLADDSSNILPVSIAFLAGSILSLFFGLLHGIRRFTLRLSEDLKSVLILSLQLAKQIVSDIGQQIEGRIEKLKQKSIEKLKLEPPPIQEIFGGVVFIVLTPMLTRAARRRIPIIGSIAAIIIEKLVNAAYMIVEPRLASNDMVLALQETASEISMKAASIGEEAAVEINSKYQLASELAMKYSKLGISKLEQVIDSAQDIVSLAVKKIIKPVNKAMVVTVFMCYILYGLLGFFE